jgi:hypothetical protein
MRMLRSVVLDPFADIEYGNLLFEYTAKLYRVFAELYCPVLAGVEDPRAEIEREKSVLVELSLFAKAVLCLNVVGDHVLIEFAGAVAEFTKRCSRKNNQALNRYPTRQLMALTQQSERRRTLRDLGEGVRIRMRNA